MMKKLYYYFGTTYRRKAIDRLMEQHQQTFKGVVLDIGGRDLGKFKKPRDKVKRWIFADIIKEHNPDMVLDVTDMKAVHDESMDVVTAIELFEHVENTEKGLKECHRVLKKGGTFMISVPFLYPIHADPYDFQRWTDHKWKTELEKLGFKIKTFVIMGRFFTLSMEMARALTKGLPTPLRQLGYMLFPIWDRITALDCLKWVQKHKKLGKFHGGYFLIAQKLN